MRQRIACAGPRRVRERYHRRIRRRGARPALNITARCVFNSFQSDDAGACRVVIVAAEVPCVAVCVVSQDDAETKEQVAEFLVSKEPRCVVPFECPTTPRRPPPPTTGFCCVCVERAPIRVKHYARRQRVLRERRRRGRQGLHKKAASPRCVCVRGVCVCTRAVSAVCCSLLSRCAPQVSELWDALGRTAKRAAEETKKATAAQKHAERMKVSPQRRFLRFPRARRAKA